MALDFTPGELTAAMKNPNFQKLLQECDSYQTTVLTPSSVKDTLVEHCDVAAILPEGCWVVFYEVFQPMASNYDIISRDSVVMVTKDKGNVVAVSFGTGLPVKAGLRYRVDYYVLPRYLQDGSLFLSHVLKQLVQIHQSNGLSAPPVSYSILHPEGMAVAVKVKEQLKMAGLQLKNGNENSCVVAMFTVKAYINKVQTKL